MNKTQITQELQELLDNTLSITPKTKHDEIKEIFLTIQEKYTPKSGGGQVKNPSYVKDEVMYHYCRYIQEYRPQDEMVMSAGKSKGYSKVAIALWTKLGKESKGLQADALKLLLTKSDDVETTNTNRLKGEELNSKAEELLVSRNKPETYKQLKTNVEITDIIE